MQELLILRANGIQRQPVNDQVPRRHSVTIFDSTLQPNRFGYIVPMICEKTSTQQHSDVLAERSGQTEKLVLVGQTVGSEEDRRRQKDKRVVLHKLWYQKNKEKLNKIRKYWPSYNWNKTHPERMRAIRKRWREKNREKLKQYHYNNREKELEQSRLWKKNNPERCRQLWYRHKAIRRNAPVGNDFLILQWRSRWINRKYSVCYWCRTKVLTNQCEPDHIVPLAKGGAHSVENLCISCRKCNRGKNAKMPAVWNQQLPQPTLEI
jgi:5-methylcytosine-specific restriction endonuclease McrA